MRNPSDKAILVWLVILAPTPVLAFANLRRWSAGRGFEPWEDNLIMYVLLEVIFGAAAVGLAILRRTKFTGRASFGDFLACALAGAAGATLLTTSLDWADDYFSGPGIGWAWPLIGLVFGSLLGLAFRSLYSFRRSD